MHAETGLQLCFIILFQWNDFISLCTFIEADICILCKASIFLESFKEKGSGSGWRGLQQFYSINNIKIDDAIFILLLFERNRILGVNQLTSLFSSSSYNVIVEPVTLNRLLHNIIDAYTKIHNLWLNIKT